MLCQPELSEEKRLEYAGAVIDASRRLADLITNILKLSKLENQQIYPKAEEYDLSEQLCQCLLQFETVWEQKNLQIETALDDGVTVCVCQGDGFLDTFWLPSLSLRDQCAHWSWQSHAIVLCAPCSSSTRLPRRCAPRNDTGGLPSLSLRDQCAHWSWQSHAIGLYAPCSSSTRLPRRCAPRNDTGGLPSLSLRDQCAHWSWQSHAIGCTHSVVPPRDCHNPFRLFFDILKNPTGTGRIFIVVFLLRNAQFLQCGKTQADAEHRHGLLQLRNGRQTRRNADVAVVGVNAVGIGRARARQRHARILH